MAFIMNGLCRALAKLCMCQGPTEVQLKEAETENLVVDRERTMSDLVNSSAMFKKRSEHIVAATERRKNDLEALLGHMKQINTASGDAHTLIERIMRGDKIYD